MKNKNPISYVFFHIYSNLFLFLSFNFTICLFELKIIENYLQVKLLPSGNYFIILSKGIYIYNPDFTLNKTIHNFTNDEIIDDYEKILISEYKIEDKLFISCLTHQKFLFIFEANKLQFYNRTLLINKFSYSCYSCYYGYSCYCCYNLNLITYKYIKNDTLDYIIYFIYGRKEDILGYDYEINFLFYEINLSNNYTQFSPKYSSIYNVYYLTNKIYVSCEKIPQQNKDLICFYVIKENHGHEDKIKSTFFDVENNFTKIETETGQYLNPYDYFYDVKTIKSYNENLLFVCYRSNGLKCICYIYDNKQNIFLTEKKTIDKCKHFELFRSNYNNEIILFCYYDYDHYYDFDYDYYYYIYEFKIFNLTNNLSHFDNILIKLLTFIF